MNPRQAAIRAAQQHFANPRDRQYFLRQMDAEAHFSDATSPAGAQGYAQLMPGTAAAWGVSNPHDPVQAYNAAAAHMASYLHQYGGSWAKALTAYNAGPGRVGGPLPAETKAYIAKILGGNADVASGATSASAAASIHATPPHSTTDVNGALIDSLLNSGSVHGSIHRDLLGHALSLINSGAYTHTTPGSVQVLQGHGTFNSSQPAGDSGQVVNLDGKPVAGWIAAELKWARAHGWNGAVQSGVRTDAQQKAIYDRGIRPAAVPKAYGGPGSNHEGTQFPMGAVDVSNAQQLAAILRNKPGGSQLVYAGPKDPVHFSHPHNGGY